MKQISRNNVYVEDSLRWGKIKLIYDHKTNMISFWCRGEKTSEHNIYTYYKFLFRYSEITYLGDTATEIKNQLNWLEQIIGL